MDNLELNLLKETVIEAIWAQWSAIGANIDSRSNARSMIDPEGLLLATLALREDERRLWDVLVTWARKESRLFSVQRVKNLLELFPDHTRATLAEFAYRAKTEGNDLRWKNLAGSEAGPPDRNQDLKRPNTAQWHPAALVVRLRLGFGVGIAPDLLSFLISQRGEWSDARRIAQATQYTVYAVRRVADDLASAQLIEVTGKKPLLYRAELERWRTSIELMDEPPRWRFWAQVYAFTTRAIAANSSGAWTGLSPYLLSTKLRDLVEQWRGDLQLAQINVPEPNRYPGAEIIPAFATMITDLAAWIEREV